MSVPSFEELAVLAETMLCCAKICYLATEGAEIGFNLAMTARHDLY